MRILTLTLLVLSLSSPLFAALPVMPKGFSYPSVKQSETPTTKANILDASPLRDGLALTDKNVVFHRAPVSPVDQKWAGGLGGLLSIEAGFGKPWSPEQVFRISLGGVVGFEKYAVATISRSKVLFENLGQLNAGKTLRSISAPEFTLYRRSAVLVLNQDGGRTWIFTSADKGKSWRLVRISYVGHPGRFTQIDYNESGKISQLTYPDKQVIKWTYQAGLPVLIALSNRRLIKINRDKSNYISTVIVYALDGAAAPEKTMLYSYQYVNDAEGRLLRFKNKCAETFTMDYKVTQSSDSILSVNTIVHDASKQYSFCRHLKGDKGLWQIESGFGGANLPLEEALVTDFRLLKQQAYKMRTIQSGINKDAPQAKQVFNLHGQLIGRVDAIGRKTVYTFDANAQVVEIAKPDDVSTSYKVDAHGRLLEQKNNNGDTLKYTYKSTYPRPFGVILPDGKAVKYGYSKTGDLVVADKAGDTHRFKYDLLGRIVEHANQDIVTSFIYTPGGRLLSSSKLIVDKKKKKTEITRFVYDVFGNLKNIGHANGKQERFVVENDLLSVVTSKTGRKAVYKCDKAGRLKRIKGFSGSVVTYKYDEYNRLISEVYEKTLGRKRRATHWEYNSLSQIVSEINTKDEERTFAYDKAGRRYLTMFPNGKRKVVAYDDRDRVIKIRGNYQAAKNYVYRNGQVRELPASNDVKDVLALIPIHKMKKVVTPPPAKGLAKIVKKEKNKDVEWYGQGEIDEAKKFLLMPEEGVAVSAMVKRLIIIGPPECELCTWVKVDWLVDFLDKADESKAYYLNTDTDQGFAWMRKIEKRLFTRVASFPAVYYRGKFYSGKKEIKAIVPKKTKKKPKKIRR